MSLNGLISVTLRYYTLHALGSKANYLTSVEARHLHSATGK